MKNKMKITTVENGNSGRFEPGHFVYIFCSVSLSESREKTK